VLEECSRCSGTTDRQRREKLVARRPRSNFGPKGASPHLAAARPPYDPCQNHLSTQCKRSHSIIRRQSLQSPTPSNDDGLGGRRLSHRYHVVRQRQVGSESSTESTGLLNVKEGTSWASRQRQRAGVTWHRCEAPPAFDHRHGPHLTSAFASTNLPVIKEFLEKTYARF
jgi:hypothetical protein